MAKKFASQIDLLHIPVLNFRPYAGSSAPSEPSTGEFWVDTSETPHRLKVYEGLTNGWVLVSQTDVELLANKGAANGYASLDENALVPLSELPVASSGTSSNALIVRADDSRLSDSRTPSGSAGGDLSGSYPNPDIGSGKVTTAKIADGAITGVKVNSAIKDAAANVASLRTLGTGATQALAGNTTLDLINQPQSAVYFNNQTLHNIGDPYLDADAATKRYVDNVARGLDVKESVRVASTANISGTYIGTGGTTETGRITSAPKVVDGVTLAANDRVLVKDQTDLTQNGIWEVITPGTGSNGVWERATDFDGIVNGLGSTEVTTAAFTFVEEGTHSGTGWVLTTTGPITIGGASGSDITWTQFSSTVQEFYTAGAGLTESPQYTFNVGGTTDRITVNADSVDIASTYAGQSSITTLGTVTTGTWNADTIEVNKGGTGATSAFDARTNLGATGKYAETLGALTAGFETEISHNLGTEDVVVSFREVSSKCDVILNWRVLDEDTIGVTADVAFSASALRAVVVG